MSFVQPDVEAMTAALEAEAKTLADRGGSLAWGSFAEAAPRER